MTNDIIQKLNNHIGNGLAEEADVTYLFVQLGKLIERERPKSDCEVLSFYRNWVVHSTLSKVEANPKMGDILGRFDAVLTEQVGGGHQSAMDLAGQFEDSISLADLKNEITRVFNEFGLNQLEDWDHFFQLLLRILADISLEADKSKKYIKELSIDGSNQPCDTLVITPRSGDPVRVPLRSPFALRAC